MKSTGIKQEQIQFSKRMKIEELDDEIYRHQARADSIFQVDENVIAQ